MQMNQNLRQKLLSTGNINYQRTIHNTPLMFQGFDGTMSIVLKKKYILILKYIKGITNNNVTLRKIR